MDADEREVRMLAVEILMLVNKGGHSAEELAMAKERLEEAVCALRPKPQAAAVG